LVGRSNDRSPEGSPALLVATTQANSYPPLNPVQVFYPCNPVYINDEEVEGGAVHYTTDGDQTILCLNVGTVWPPPDTVVVATLTGGRWCFAYFG
jgi:hypothetical protein